VVTFTPDDATHRLVERVAQIAGIADAFRRARAIERLVVFTSNPTALAAA